MGFFVYSLRSGPCRVPVISNSRSNRVGGFVMGEFPSQPRLTEAWTHSAGAFRALVENLEHCVYVLNSAGRFVAVNQPFCRWVGKPETEVLGLSIVDLWPRPWAEKEADEHQRVLRGERIEAEEERPRGRDSSLVRLLKVPVRSGEGDVRGVLCLFREAAVAARAVAAGTPAPPTRQQQTILLTDNDPSILQLAQLILRQANYRVLTAENGRQALDIYRPNQAIVDLVILDQHMPVLSGLETMNELLAMNPRLRILLVSGDRPPPSWGDRTPGWGFLSKPYTADQLEKAVQDVLVLGERPA